MRDYDRIIKVLKAEADRLADFVELAQVHEKFDTIYKSYRELSELEKDYFQRKVGTPQEQQALEDMIRLRKSLDELIANLQEYLFQKRIRRKPVKEKIDYET